MEAERQNRTDRRRQGAVSPMCPSEGTEPMTERSPDSQPLPEPDWEGEEIAARLYDHIGVVFDGWPASSDPRHAITTLRTWVQRFEQLQRKRGNAA